MEKKAHVVMVPYPAQGHVIPMLELANIIAKHHVKITFVNTENIHNRVVDSSLGGDDDDGHIRFVSVPDGLESWEREIPGKLIETVWRDMPRKVEDLIRDLYAKEDLVTCLVCDLNLGTIVDVAKKMGIQSAVFMATPAAVAVSAFNIPKLIQDGTIDNEGTPLHNNAFQFAPTMPILTASDFVWHRVQPEISTVRKLVFEIMRKNNASVECADRVLCNSTYDLEMGAFSGHDIIPVGPLLASNRQGSSGGHFWKQDYDSKEWLDQQPPTSVVYAAFGSSTMLNKAQFQELALGLEQMNRPFLWVVRLDHTTSGLEFPEGFLQRVSRRGRIIGWASQQKVLSHPSIACFITHCGWNSTVESVSNGVPMLCWPYFADHFIIQSYICDIWQVGLQFEHDSSGNIMSGEFKKKIDVLLGDAVYKERALQLKELITTSAKEGGSTNKNLRSFISWIQEY